MLQDSVVPLVAYARGPVAGLRTNLADGLTIFLACVREYIYKSLFETVPNVSVITSNELSFFWISLL